MEYKTKLVEEIVGLEARLWIPMHRELEDTLIHMDIEELIKYHRKIRYITDNPV